MQKQQTIQELCRQLKLAGMAESIGQMIETAQNTQESYTDFALRLLQKETGIREAKSLERRIKAAQLPLSHNLDLYDFSSENGISKTALNQLRELNWLDQVYNIILMGPSGAGKSFIAAGLCYQAIINGYKAYFRTMDEVIKLLKMKDITRSATMEMKRLEKANLIVIDDIMLFPIDKPTAVALFNFINHHFEKTSFIVTTNKSPKQWAQMLDDEVLATAILDRLLFRCEVLKLEGKSYRMKNRKTILNNN